MQLPTDLLTYVKWSAIATLAFFVLMVFAFIFQWGIRFRLFGVTAFMCVLTVGIFGLDLGLFTREEIPGAVRYTLVYDDAAANVVIVVPPESTPDEVEATLKQAAIDISPFGRLGTTGSTVTIRARTVTHPEPGLSELLYLGQVQKPSQSRDSADLQVKLFRDRFAELPEVKSQGIETREGSSGQGTETL
jgi:hypothetical protein